MERRIGEIFEYNGEWYQAIDNTHGVMCRGCTFVNEYNECEADISVVGNCGCKDDNPLIFKKLEKVGEPMKIHDRLVLKVKADAYKCMRCCFYSKGKCELTMEECVYYDCGEGTKFIEIKQNKEDMEEKKLNLKPFDLEAAKQGKPVCTRDGRKVRIICFDRNWDMHIVALVADPLGESVHYYLSNGKVDINKENDEDLMMLSEKKEGWTNIYKGDLYDTLESAKENCVEDNGYIKTIKVEWEE